MDHPSRPTIATIDLGNLARNLSACREFIGEGCGIVAVVKADAYGHGAEACARRLQDEGVDWFAVAIPEEGVQLRQAGITVPILSLGAFWPGQEDDLISNAVTPVIADLQRAEWLDRVARERGCTVAVHVKVDTGMGRIGILPDESARFASALKEFKHIAVEGLMTHLAVADDLTQSEYTDSQCALFEESLDIFLAAGHEIRFADVANSPGAVAHPRTRRNLVRLGGILYGLGGDVLPGGIPAPKLLPVMSLTTEISGVKEFPAGSSLGYGRTFETKRPSRIATIPIGYHDGLPRAASNVSSVIVKGTQVPIVGRVSMDWTIIDVTDVPEGKIGDRVTIIGTDGTAERKAEDLARETGTISYEITCGLSSRVPRSYDQG